ncbi:SNF2 family N-terminal domain-containing protein [Bipolaris maydis]|nr:SNF2 family N-terminal domain-containing protein [Bipolaris maydis]
MKRPLSPTDNSEASKRWEGVTPIVSYDHLSTPDTSSRRAVGSPDEEKLRNVPQVSATSSSHQPEEPGNLKEICYGSLLELNLQVREDPLTFRDYSSQNARSDFVELETTFVGGYLWMNIRDAISFGCLNQKISQVLKRLKSLSSVEIEGIVSRTSLEKARAEWKKSGRSANLLVDINVYGPNTSGVAKPAGRILSNARLFLQPPSFVTRLVTYDNPQYLKLPNVSELQIMEAPSTNFAAPLSGSAKESTYSELESVLDNIPQSKILREVSTSWRIRTVLKNYQREAVDFMTRRETRDLPPSLSLWKPHSLPGGPFCYKHVITGAKSSEMDDALGGIFADDMGLGKTLTTLAVIVGSLERALNYAVGLTRGSTNSWKEIVPCKTTLIIVPSSLLLESWEDEITKHIEPGTLMVHRFHGLGKRVDLAHLLRMDIVLTTYATVAAEFCRGKSTLNRIAWYRLVLDEAHYIRNPLRKQFRAIQTIPAHIRWCLTGTPIQNSLEDLAALVKFLQVPVLDDLASFRKHISTPILSKTNNRFGNLSRLLEAICLRRTKSILKQPEPVMETILLQFSAEEQTQYEDYAASCKHYIDLAVSGHSFKKANQQVVQAILGLRLFCNDGERSLAKRSSAYGLPTLPEEALSFLQTSSDAVCIQCGCEIMVMYQGDDKSSGVLTVCHHLICGECLPDFEADLDENSENGRSCCPFCGLRAERSSFVIIPSDTEKSTDLPTTVWPTKLRAILDSVQRQGSNDKCIIFSAWKTTLDIMASILDVALVPYFRIHGSIPASRRSKVLDDFEQSTTVRVLLITLGTGAVGLNKMKAANIVHIIEPQWNPSVENQAIGRIIRLGQEKAVKIFRYIMKGTVEEAVQSRQLRKLQLARGGFGLSKDDHSEKRIGEIMSLICPSIS